MTFEEIVFLTGNDILNAIKEDGARLVVHKPSNDCINAYVYLCKGYLFQ